VSTSFSPPPWDAPLARALCAALGRLPAGVPRSVLFSGGVDSGLLAWELLNEPAVTLNTVGLAGAADLAAAESAASELRLPWKSVTLTEDEVFEVARRIEPETRTLSPTARSVEVAFALAVQHASPGVIVCGQGADELFFGYAHFRGLDEEGAERRGDADLRYLLGEAWPRSRRIAATMHRQIVAPYLDPAFLSAAREIPVAERLAGPMAKQTFRSFARRRGLPASIADRPKKALQFGSGVDHLLRRTRARAGRIS
jgi:asparagine synthase (glutamine-hydrolysing)